MADITSVITIIFWAAIALFVCLIIGVFMYMLQVQKKGAIFEVKDKHRNKNLVATYTMMPKKDHKTGSLWYKSVFWQPKISIPEPPQEIIDLTTKGKKIFRAYRISEDQYAWAKDLSGSIDDFAKLGYKEFTVTQREVLANQFIKAEEYKKHWLKDNIVPLGMIFMCGLIVVLCLVMWQDMAKPVLEIGDKLIIVQDQQIQMMKALNIKIENQSTQIKSQSGTTTAQPSWVNQIGGAVTGK